MDKITDDDKKKCANKPDMELWHKPVPMSVDMGCGKGFSGIIGALGKYAYYDDCHRHRHAARGKAAVKVQPDKNGPAWDENCDGGRHYFEYMANQFNNAVYPKKKRKHKEMILYGTRMKNFVDGMIKVKHPAFMNVKGWWNQYKIKDENENIKPCNLYYNDTVLEWLDILKKQGWGGPGNEDVDREGGPKKKREARPRAIKNLKMLVREVRQPKLAEVAAIAKQAKEEEDAMKSYKEFVDKSIRDHKVFYTWEELPEEAKESWKEKNHGDFGEQLREKERRARIVLEGGRRRRTKKKRKRRRKRTKKKRKRRRKRTKKKRR